MHVQNAIGTVALAALLFLPSVTSARATQTESQTDAAHRTEILFLGTAGGPILRPDRSEPATLLTVDGHPYLIDCGIGTVRRLVKAGIHSDDVKAIFFTHLHADHDMGLADLMANDFFERGPAGAADPIDIYGPPQTRELVDSAFRFISVGFRPFAAENPSNYRASGKGFVSPFIAHEFSHDGVIYRDNEIRVTAAENSHYVLIPPRQRAPFKSFSLRIETPQGAIVFTGDTGPSEAVAQLAKGADVLVAEATSRDPEDRDSFINAMAARNRWSSEHVKAFRDHFQFEHLNTQQIGDLASKAGVKSVLLYHYVPRDKADQAAYVNEVGKFFAGAVFAPDDLSKFCMGRRGTDASIDIQHC